MRLRTVLGVLLGALALAASPARAQKAADFDFYVFTLSWSPGFCDLGGGAKSPSQCASGAGVGFVVHGLWPDRSFGRNPENCRYGVAIPGDALRLTRGVYPDEGLARYEYLKHGTCAGLDPRAYFAAVKSLRDQIFVPAALTAPREPQRFAPDDLARAFVAVNPNLRPDDMAITCSHGELVDVRICVSRNLRAFATCPKVSGHTCHASTISVAPVR